MKKERTREREPLGKRADCGADADHLAKLHSHEYDPSPKKRSVKKFETPTEPATDTADWDAWFDGEGVSEDFMEDRGEHR